jgi:hypothetical protein
MIAVSARAVAQTRVGPPTLSPLYLRLCRPTRSRARVTSARPHAWNVERNDFGRKFGASTRVGQACVGASSAALRVRGVVPRSARHHSASRSASSMPMRSGTHTRHRAARTHAHWASFHLTCRDTTSRDAQRDRRREQRGGERKIVLNLCGSRVRSKQARRAFGSRFRPGPPACRARSEEIRASHKFSTS